MIFLGIFLRIRNLEVSFISGYKLYSLRVIPAIKKSTSPKDKVFVEKYSVIEPCFEKVDMFEKEANYSPIEVEDKYFYDLNVYPNNNYVLNNGNIDKALDIALKNAANKIGHLGAQNGLLNYKKLKK